MNIKTKCVVVGASAVGSAAAYYLSKKGIDVALLEEHPIAGKFHKCSGLFSKKGLEKTGLKYKESILNPIRKARIVFPEDEFEVGSSIIQAYVTNRQKLDEMFCEQANHAGASVFFNKRFESGFLVNDKVLSNFSGNFSAESEFLLGCDGVNSTVSAVFGFPKISSDNIALAYEVEIGNCNIAEKDKVIVFLNQKKYPGFFAWMIPVSESIARIGVATNKHEKLNLSKQNLFFEKQIIDILKGKKIKIIRDFYHTIPIQIRQTTQKSNVLLVGDSAGQTKSTTGGGVIFGTQCAKIAADSIESTIKNNIPLNYEYLWRNDVGKTLYAHRKMREVYNWLDNSSLNIMSKSFKLFNGPSLLSKYGDMDNILA